MNAFLEERLLDRFRNIRIPILTKITIPYALLALLIAVGGSYIITNVVIDSVEERFTNQLIETGLLTSESIVRKEDDLLENLRLISHAQGIDDAINDNQLEMLNQLVLPTAYNAGLEAIIVVNRFGRELISLQFNIETREYEELILQDDWQNNDFFQHILKGDVDSAGDKYAGLLRNSEQDYLFVGGPVLDENGVFSGAVFIGDSITNIIQTLREETLAQMSFYTLDGKVISSTLLEVSALDSLLTDAIIQTQAEGSLSREFTDNAIGYQELLSPFEVRNGEDIGFLGVALPTSFLSQTSQITRANTLIFMTVILFLVIVVGIYIAGIITRPILDLKEAAIKVSKGDLNVRVKATGRDEVSILANSFNEMVDSISKSKQDLLEAYDKTIEGWAMALDLRDHETEGHSRRVTEFAVELAKRFGIKDETLENLRRGALLHDIGKIGIPDSILLKKGPLTDEEYNTMKQHPSFAHEFMGAIEFLSPAIDIHYSHHEKWDGSGYPDGLKGEEIPAAARIFAIIDVWDAITKDRPYREAMAFNEALKVIEDGRGSHFDPLVTDEFLQLLMERVDKDK